MESNVSPLKKYQREPKLYVDLPSKGNWYPKGTLETAGEVPVYSMTASDEIKLKTPDALYTGQAVAKMIERCVPSIKDAFMMPIVDLDYLLAAIRLASYGDTLNLTGKCSECNNEDTFGIELQTLLDHYSNAQFEYEIRVEDFILRLRPLTFKELTEIQKESFIVQRQLAQYIPTIKDEEEKQKVLNELYDRINTLQENVIYSIVTEITTPDGDKETHHNFIVDFLKNGESVFFKAVKDSYQKSTDRFAIPQSMVACSECKHEYNIQPSLDYANFFVRG